MDISKITGAMSNDHTSSLDLQQAMQINRMLEDIQNRRSISRSKQNSGNEAKEIKRMPISEDLKQADASDKRVPKDEFTKDELRALLKDPVKLTQLYRQYQRYIDRDNDGFLSGDELKRAKRDESLNRDCRLLASALLAARNSLMGMGGWGSYTNSFHGGIRAKDIEVYASASNYVKPRWWSPASDGAIGSLERETVFAAGFISSELLASRLGLRPLARLGLGAFCLAPWTYLESKHVESISLGKRHEAIQKMLKSLE
jgi:hypothetical protein